MNAGTWAFGHRRSVLFLLAALACCGVVVGVGLPASLFPSIDFPRVVVSIDAGDQPAEQMEVQTTRPVEVAIRRVAGVRSVRSTTSRGSAEISVNFDWGLDMASATLQVDAAATQVLARLPPGTVLTTKRMDPTVFPIIAYSLTSATLSPTRLRELADLRIAPALSSIAGVSRVQAIGGALAEIEVLVDPTRLQARDLALDDVTKALAAANVITAVGRVEDRYKLLLVLTDAPLDTADAIGRTIVATGGNGVVLLRDIATVQQGSVPEWTRVTADGRAAVLLSIYQQPGSNSVRIAADVKAALQSQAGQWPPGVRIANWYDQSDLVLASASSVRDAILIGAVLAAIVLYVFLRDLRITLIAVAVVPAVLALTVLVLRGLGLGFNIMTLGGMAAAVGLVIDDAIVMTEHIVRRMREETGDTRATVIRAAGEFLRPLAGSSAATLVIFAPLALLTGVTGAFFKALSITMAASLVISFLVTWLAVPILAASWLRGGPAAESGRIDRWCRDRYASVLGRLLDRPWLVLVGLVPLAVLGIVAFTQVGSGFMPSIDEGGFVLDYRSRPGTALSETDRLLRQVESLITATPDVLTYSRRTGTGLGGGLSEANSGDFFIRLKTTGRRPVDQVMDDLRGRIESTVPGLSIEMAQLMEDLIGDLTAVPQPVEIKLYADRPADLDRAARSVALHLAKVPGIVDVKDGINIAGDALEIHVDRARAALEGVDPGQVSSQVAAQLSGSVATRILSGVQLVGVRVWVPPSLRSSAADVGDLRMRAPDGHLFPLRRVAQVDTVTGQPEIDRENLRRMVGVTARISGRDLGSVVADVNGMLAGNGVLPSNVQFALGGLYEQQQIAFKGLIGVFVAAAALVFLLLLFLYESFRLALSVILASLTSVSAVFIGLWLTGIDLNITAMMGMTMIIGIVTEVAIFYFSEQQSLVGVPLARSLIEAGQNRMRPIAMTTFAAILTLLPLAFALGRGSEMQQPLAIAIVSGLLVQLPLVLLAMPVAFHAMHGRAAQAPVPIESPP